MSALDLLAKALAIHGVTATPRPSDDDGVDDELTVSDAVCVQVNLRERYAIVSNEVADGEFVMYAERSTKDLAGIAADIKDAMLKMMH